MFLAAEVVHPPRFRDLICVTRGPSHLDPNREESYKRGLPSVQLLYHIKAIVLHGANKFQGTIHIVYTRGNRGGMMLPAYLHKVATTGKPVHVRGHYRKQGETRTFVDPHDRIMAQRKKPVAGPFSKEIRPIPTVRNQVWEFCIQDHKAKRAGRHFDIRIADYSGNAHSWAVRSLPEPGKPVVAHQTFTHPAAYMNFQGVLSGYGGGSVLLHTRTRALVHTATPDKVTFSVITGRGSQDYAMVRVGDTTWLFHAMTPAPSDIPRGRADYGELGWRNKLLERDDVIIGAKLKGAHTIVLLQPGKRARAFSHRESKIGDILEYTHKIPGIYDTKVSGGTGPTVLRGETLALDAAGKPVPESELSGLLNSTILNSRAAQASRGLSLKTFLFDIDKLNGTDVSSLPYNERYKLIQKLASRYPVFSTAPIATTLEEKRKLLDDIESGKHPLTDEGVVLWVPGKGPYKEKIRPDHDVYVRQVFPGQGRLNNSAGGFLYSWTKDGPVVGAVGTGLNDKLREDMWKNKDSYIGRVARVTAEGKYPSGALSKPAFQDWHLEKNV